MLRSGAASRLLPTPPVPNPGQVLTAHVAEKSRRRREEAAAANRSHGDQERQRTSCARRAWWREEGRGHAETLVEVWWSSCMQAWPSGGLELVTVFLGLSF